MKKRLLLGLALATMLATTPALARLQDVDDPGAVSAEVMSALEAGNSVDQIMADIMANPNRANLVDDVVATLLNNAASFGLTTDTVVTAALSAGATPTQICAGAGSDTATRASVIASMNNAGVPAADIATAACANNVAPETVAAGTSGQAGDSQAYTPPAGDTPPAGQGTPPGGGDTQAFTPAGGGAAGGGIPTIGGTSGGGGGGGTGTPSEPFASPSAI